MKFIHYIYSTLLLTLLSACQGNEVIRYVYSVGEADNAIVLSAGISEGGEGVTTRAVANPDANHAKHVALSEGTVMRLRVDGDWWKSEAQTATEVKQITDAKAGDIVTSTDDKHRKLKDYSPQLYWDDYGTADPSNTVSGKGREKGLNIYGATVNGLTTLPDALKNNLDNTSAKWTNLAWNVGTPSTGTDPAIDQTSGWSNYDLLTSNNVVYSLTADQDNAYKFSEHTAGKLLEFTHAMTKITVNLTAADGFPLSGVVPQFQNAPTVTLLGFNYTGNVNVESKNSTPTTNTTTNIQAHFANFIESTATEWTAATSTWTKSYKTQFDALVFPGNSFADATDIIKINCDGNIYYVNATKINAAMNTAGDTDKAFKQGKNYIFNITVKKTKIEVTATIKGWEDVEAETVQPLININAQVGTIGTTGASLSAFEFYMSTTKADGYTAYGNATGTADGTTNWQFKDGETNISLFWPTHNTHYFMRGVSPTATTVSDNKQIAVSNSAYSSTTSPSNLMIGAPEVAASTMCGNTEHTQVDMSTGGICARNNTINLNFRYVMSQVEVRLKSSGTDEKKNKVTIDGNTTVEIIGGYKQARIQLGTRLHDDYTDSDKSTSYSMSTSSATLPTGFSRVMHDIIVPQTLTDDMQFKITVKNADETTDVYYAQLNKIKVKKADGSGEFITEWKPDEHYIYELDIIKTEINVTATLTDWNTVDATQPVWF